MLQNQEICENGLQFTHNKYDSKIMGWYISQWIIS